MAHLHEVRDMDTHFIIDPLNNMAITNANEARNNLQLGDHDSEVYTFELPRFIEGHDMTLCNLVEVHFINAGSDKVHNSNGVFVVEDMEIADDGNDTLLFTWTVSGDGTKYAGSLNFRIKFSCIEDGKYTYKKWSATFKGIIVADGFDNGEYIETEYADVLAAWESRLVALEHKPSGVQTVNGVAPDGEGNVVVEVPSQVQSDLSVNDESDPAYVKGVIRYESLPYGYPFDSRQINTIEWDGDTTDKYVWEYSTDFDLCRVSDDVPLTTKNIIGQHLITNLSGEQKDMIITEDMIEDRGSMFSVYNDSYKDTELVHVILDDTQSTQSAGVYFNLWRQDAYGNLSGEHVVSISYESGKLEYMDDKFLPSVPGENLPSGTPWKNIDKIPETIFEYSFSNGQYGSMGAIYYKNIPPAEGIADMTFVAGELYECIVNGNSFIMSVNDSTRLIGGAQHSHTLT